MKRVTLKKNELSYDMTEGLNTLRTNIQFSGIDKKVIVMTSCLAGERKIYDHLSVGKIFCRAWKESPSD